MRVWIDGRRTGRMDGTMELGGCRAGRMGGECMRNGWVDGELGGWMGGWRAERRDGRMESWEDGEFVQVDL